MKKEILLKQIAEKAYDIGFGAKKHFATFDIVKKVPGLISFISIVVGILALYINALTTKDISATLIIIGVIGVYISAYDDISDDYNNTGIELTKLFNKLKILYNKVKSSSKDDYVKEIEELEAIQDIFFTLSKSKQIMFSDWYAHYIFFWKHQIEWINEQLKFSFWRDKMPLSGTITLVLLILLVVLA
jgi:hypothetical protein